MHRRAERYRFLSQHTEHGCGTAQAGVAQDQMFLRIDRQLCVSEEAERKGVPGHTAFKRWTHRRHKWKNPGRDCR